MSNALIRTLILYLLAIFAVRLMGKRQIGELEPSDLVVTILISDLATIPMQDPDIPLVAGAIPIFTLVAVEILVSYACIRSRKLHRLVNGQSAIIIRNGKLDAKKIRQLRISLDEVIEALRTNNIASVSHVRYAMIEPNGQLSYVLYHHVQPLTAEMLGIAPPTAGVPLVVIADGKLIQVSLDRLHMDREDLRTLLKKRNINRIADVLIMTLDDCGNLFIQKKGAHV